MTQPSQSDDLPRATFTYAVRFHLDEWDEIREYSVRATSDIEAIATAEREHPWEADNASHVTANSIFLT